ncbi:MAG: NAD(+) synthase [Clostridia bacterium]|nr:NAD(+) synthase [Clostridia bacterium]
MKKLKTEIVGFIKKYVAESGAKGAVIGMSGGKDSFVAAALCCEALGNENVFGVIMPDGKMQDLKIAKEECELLKIKYKVINIAKITKNIKKNTQKSLKISLLSDITTLNIAPRVRMTVLYSLAGTLGYLVVNTSNLSETMIGYTTKWGDNVGDFAPLASLTKTEVCELGIEMGLPQNLILKKPADGLSGQTDEEKIGFSYVELDNLIRDGKYAKNCEKILKMQKNSIHKRTFPPKFDLKRKNYLQD